jgi:hypothetical protein
MQICNATSDAKIIHFLPMQFRIHVVCGSGADIFRVTNLNTGIRVCAASQGIRI